MPEVSIVVVLNAAPRVEICKSVFSGIEKHRYNLSMKMNYFENSITKVYTLRRCIFTYIKDLPLTRYVLDYSSSRYARERF